MGKLKTNESTEQRDYLTGFLNRQGLYEYFASLADNTKVSFMFLDIDNFKGVNDTYGHAMGDKLLVCVSKMIKSLIGNARLARLGGDEFVILVTGMVTENMMKDMAQKILDCVSSLDIDMEIKSIISFSIGIVMSQRKSKGLDNIMPKCDAAMYEAKRRGKNGYVVYSMIEDLFEMQQMIDREKNKALANKEFEVRYIPVMDLLGSKMVFCKTYIVWNRKGMEWREDFFREFIKDGTFLMEMEAYAFRNLCQALSCMKFEKLKRLPVMFPVSGVNVNRVDLADKLLEIIHSNGLQSSNFIIELENIDERISREKLALFLKKLKQAGFMTAVKGPGKGGSTVILMKNLEIDYVLIDRNIIENMLGSRKEGLFVKNIISLVNDLNLEPIVEGIDNAMEVRYLISYGCNVGMGQYFSDALSGEDFMKFFVRNMPEQQKSVHFSFQNTLADNTGKYVGEYIGEDRVKFVYDKQLQRQVLYLPGGDIFSDIVELPVALLNNLSYTIILHFKVSSLLNWSALLYALYGDGFMAFMPYAWNGVAMFRIKNDQDDNGWYDAIGEKIDTSWHTAVMTFHHKTQVMNLYIDRKLVGSRENASILSAPKRLVLGGDVYTKGCQSYISDLIFFDHVLSKKEIERY